MTIERALWVICDTLETRKATTAKRLALSAASKLAIAIVQFGDFHRDAIVDTQVKLDDIADELETALKIVNALRGVRDETLNG